MKYNKLLSIALLFSSLGYAQTFVRSELPTSLTTPWEITYGPDNFLWITEFGGKVSRVNPLNGAKTTIYTAPDFFEGSVLEGSPTCPNAFIGSGTLGLALHPDFSNTATSYVYFVYSYNSGTAQAPATKFRIKRLTWDSNSNTVIADSNIVNAISTGYDHLGGRLLAVKQNNTPYLFLSIGDHGVSEENTPDCYSPQSSNPNNFTQDISTQNGKIHRFNMDGSIPADNPVGGNSMYTRGHRNPQGLMYNPDLEILYDVEHGNRTDDEINVLHKGMNYGWKQVRGYHDDDSFSGESDFVSNYVPNALIANDSLVEPIYAWCNTPSTSTVWTDWCTVAPSGGMYYGSDGISEWENSLLVVTLKDGLDTDKEVFQFKLEANGDLVPSTVDNPNPKQFFAEDQDLNGRLRDITVSNDGKRVYLINNGGGMPDGITVYTYQTIGVPEPLPNHIKLYPNPVNNKLSIDGLTNLTHLKEIRISSVLGQSISVNYNESHDIDVSNLASGIHFVYIVYEKKTYVRKFIKE